MKLLLTFFALPVLLTACSVSKFSLKAEDKFSKTLLQQDFSAFKHLLETAHPSLYWYTPKPKMDSVFDAAFSAITDSMTERPFRRIMQRAVTNIGCGHTTIRPAVDVSKHYDTLQHETIFPLSLKIWPDTAVVTHNLNRRDTVLKRGTIIKSVNHIPIEDVIKKVWDLFTSDGVNTTHKYQLVSSIGAFDNFLRNFYSINDSFLIKYINGNGVEDSLTVAAFRPMNDSIIKQKMGKPANKKLSKAEKKQVKKEMLDNTRLLQIDTAAKSAMLTLNTFSNGYKLQKFIKQSFKNLAMLNVEHLIIDLRKNGGGSISTSTLLTQYLADKKFKLCDSLYAISMLKGIENYIKRPLLMKLYLGFFTKKHSDGKYHLKLYEKTFFAPKKKYHFDKQVYLLTSGKTFSAASMVAGQLQGQQNITIIGEETGGGAYGNTAWQIVKTTLPNTKIELIIPLFRAVFDKTKINHGRGIVPDVYCRPSIEGVKTKKDTEVEKALELKKTKLSSRP